MFKMFVHWFWEYHQVVEVGSQERYTMQNIVQHSLKGCRRVYKPKQHDFKLICSRTCYEHHHLLAVIFRLCLSISWEQIKCRKGLDYLELVVYFFDFGERPTVSARDLVQSPIVYAKSGLPVHLSSDWNWKRPSRWSWGNNFCLQHLSILYFY